MSSPARLKPDQARLSAGRRPLRAAPAARWFAVWTRSRHEQVVREQIDAEAHRGVPADVTRWSRWKDRKKKIDWPLFPGYCFARFDPAARLAILKCTGVVSIVSFDGEPAPIPDLEIDGIRRLVESDLQFDPCPMIREGQMVEVVARSADRRRRTAGPQGRARAAGAVGRSDRTGRQRRSGCGGRQSVLTVESLE